VFSLFYTFDLPQGTCHALPVRDGRSPSWRRSLPEKRRILPEIKANQRFTGNTEK
jgi:hypothetical protein